MQHLEVSGAVRHIYIYIYIIRWLKVNIFVENIDHRDKHTQGLLDNYNVGGMFTDNRGNYIRFMSVGQSEGQIGSVIA